MADESEGALAGLKVVSCAHQYPGPYCGLLLADLGADVVKVEPPGTGDPARFLEPFFQEINRNHRSLTLNLKHPAGRAALRRLAAGADVFLDGYRPGVMARLGCDYETLRPLNPGLVYCAITGFGQDGPERDLAGHDINYTARAGLLDQVRDQEGRPVAIGVSIADLSSGLFAAYGVLAALLARARSGRGQYVDVSMADGLVSWLGTTLASYRATGKERDRDVAYGLFETADQRWLSLGIAHEDHFWRGLCPVVGLDDVRDLRRPERFARRAELLARLRAALLTRPADEWLPLLTAADVPVALVSGLADVVRDPQFQVRGLFPELDGRVYVGLPVRFSETPGRITRPAPDLGEHSAEILAEAGYSPAEIAQLKEEGAV